MGEVHGTEQNVGGTRRRGAAGYASSEALGGEEGGLCLHNKKWRLYGRPSPLTTPTLSLKTMRISCVGSSLGADVANGNGVHGDRAVCPATYGVGRGG